MISKLTANYICSSNIKADKKKPEIQLITKPNGLVSDVFERKTDNKNISFSANPQKLISQEVLKLRREITEFGGKWIESDDLAALTAKLKEAKALDFGYSDEINLSDDGYDFRILDDFFP